MSVLFLAKTCQVDAYLILIFSLPNLPSEPIIGTAFIWAGDTRSEYSKINIKLIHLKTQEILENVN